MSAAYIYIWHDHRDGSRTHGGPLATGCRIYRYRPPSNRNRLPEYILIHSHTSHRSWAPSMIYISRHQSWAGTQNEGHEGVKDASPLLPFGRICTAKRERHTGLWDTGLAVIKKFNLSPKALQVTLKKRIRNSRRVPAAAAQKGEREGHHIHVQHFCVSAYNQ